jgi:hypothetical protein
MPWLPTVRRAKSVLAPPLEMAADDAAVRGAGAEHSSTLCAGSSTLCAGLRPRPVSRHLRGVGRRRSLVVMVADLAEATDALDPN